VTSRFGLKDQQIDRQTVSGTSEATKESSRYLHAQATRKIKAIVTCTKRTDNDISAFPVYNRCT